ncbi:MAG: DUF6922 domain-containing protein [Chitinophagaceae bacterium]
MKKNLKYTINDFSPHLFWDINKNELDFNKYTQQIIKGVLEYGLLKDWKIIHNYYGIKKIAEVASDFKELDPKACAFISALSGIPLKKFRCYSTRQLIPQHWNF